MEDNAHMIKTYTGIEGSTPLLLNLGTSSRSVGSLTLQKICPSVRAPSSHRGDPRPVKAFQGAHKISRLSPNSKFIYLYFVSLLAVSVNVFIARQL